MRRYHIYLYVLMVVVVAPFLLGIVFELLSGNYFSRDSVNYINELSVFNFEPRVEYISWSLLALLNMVLSDELLFPSISFLLLVLMISLIAVRYGGYTLYIFLLSILPIWINVFGSQIRVAIFILFYTLLYRKLIHNRLYLLILATLTHKTGLFFVFPFLSIISLGLVSVFGSLPFRYAELFNGYEMQYRFYYGWELILISACFLYHKFFRDGLFIFLLAFMLNVSQSILPVDISRRLIELFILYFSPFFYMLHNGISLPKIFLLLYLLLGFLHVYFSYGNVISLSL
tara:strand:+ start:246 stop:1106 length:861 start_codon:yes stop_codon:yes gene_type:complete